MVAFRLDAFGGRCVYDEVTRAGVQHGVLGLVAGEAALTMSNLEDADLIEKVLESLPPVLGSGRERLIEGRVHRWAGSVNGLPGGRPMRAPEVRHRPEPIEHPKLFVVGDYLFDSTVNGVLDSAELVADRIVEEVTGSIVAPIVLDEPARVIESAYASAETSSRAVG